MADGIALYFDQALTNRLLYPSEISQYIVLEETLLDDDSPLEKVDIYGCEHLLRLISIMPRILDQQYQDMKKAKMEQKNSTSADKSNTEEGGDEDDDFAKVGSVILAKLQDLARFLQKNQSTLFCSRYRKKTDEELKTERKIQKRQERRLKQKNKASMLLEEENDDQQETTEEMDVDEHIP